MVKWRERGGEGRERGGGGFHFNNEIYVKCHQLLNIRQSPYSISEFDEQT